MTTILPQAFYQKPALELTPMILGKYLVRKTEKGILPGQITEVEAYPSWVDNVSQGNKRTPRTEILYAGPGFTYIYLVYGLYYMLCVSTNKKAIPDCVLIRSVIPDEGVEIMRENYGREVQTNRDLTNSPGKLCKSFGISKELYGEPVTGNRIWIEDRGVVVDHSKIQSTPRIGISKNLKGWDLPYRFVVVD
ncbi:DNA-3-methyladenine glycosylase [Candidatus Dojkabacteria bacterium]|nr:DNA-3-methyladenine glycosylase [Candidatus Dojkabacteria bacterium]